MSRLGGRPPLYGRRPGLRYHLPPGPGSPGHQRTCALPPSPKGSRAVVNCSVHHTTDGIPLGRWRQGARPLATEPSLPPKPTAIVTSGILRGHFVTARLSRHARQNRRIYRPVAWPAVQFWRQGGSCDRRSLTTCKTRPTCRSHPRPVTSCRVVPEADGRRRDHASRGDPGWGRPHGLCVLKPTDARWNPKRYRIDAARCL